MLGITYKFGKTIVMFSESHRIKYFHAHKNLFLKENMCIYTHRHTCACIHIFIFPGTIIRHRYSEAIFSEIFTILPWMKIFVIFDHIQTNWRLNTEDTNANKSYHLIFCYNLEFEILFSGNLWVFLEICLFRITDLES